LHAGKRAVADFYAERILPQSQALLAGIAAGERSTMTLAVDAF
jgi:hypothetical protein